MNWALILGILAIWGSFLSTLLAVLKIMDYYKDRADVRVNVEGGLKIHPPTTEYGDKEYVVIKAVNVGRRIVTIHSAALLLPRSKTTKNKYLRCLDPRTAMSEIELSEGKSHSYIVLEEGLERDYGLVPANYIACVWDSKGKRYWSHNWLTRLIKLQRIR